MQQSVTEFTKAGQEYNMEMPKDLAARAGAYIELGQYKNAFTDLNKAAAINYDYFWNLGNYYEVIGNKDSAISCYTKLYNQDTLTYKYCQNRIIELKNPKTKLSNQLSFRDRLRRIIHLKGIE